MKAILFSIRVWPNKDKVNSDGKIDITKGEYTELTLLNLESGKIELYNVTSDLFSKWEVAEEDYSKLCLDNSCKVLSFETAVNYGKTKIVDCIETDEVIVLRKD